MPSKMSASKSAADLDKSPAKKVGVYRQPRPRPKPHAGPTNTAAARGEALAFSTDDAFIGRFTDPREDDGTHAMLRRYQDSIHGAPPKKPVAKKRPPKKLKVKAEVEEEAEAPPVRVVIVREPGTEPVEPDRDEDRPSTGPPKTPLAPRASAMSADWNRKAEAAKKAKRLKDICDMPLGKALKGLMCDWAQTEAGGAILKHVPALPLGIFDDSDHVEYAQRAWDGRGSTNAVALRSDGLVAADGWEGRLGAWVACDVEAHGARTHTVRWADGPWPPTAKVPACAVVGVWQDRFRASARLQGALARRAACEERLRLRHFFESAPRNHLVVASLRHDLFPDLHATLLNSAARYGADGARVDRFLEEVDRDYAIAMQGHIFECQARAARKGEAPMVDKHLLSSDRTLDLAALDAAAVALTPGYVTASLDDYELLKPAERMAGRRRFEAAREALRVARGEAAGKSLEREGATYQIEGDADPGATRKGDHAVLPLRAGLSAPLAAASPKKIVEAAVAVVRAAPGPRCSILGSRPALKAVQAATAANAEARLECAFLEFPAPNRQAPGAFRRHQFELLSKALDAVEQHWPAAVGAAMSDALKDPDVVPGFDPRGATSVEDIFGSERGRGAQEPLRRLLARVRAEMATELDRALKEATRRYVAAVEAAADGSDAEERGAHLRGAWFRLDLELLPEAAPPEAATAARRRRASKKWTFASRCRLKESVDDLREALVVPLRRMFQGCAAVQDPSKVVLAHLPHVPPSPLNVPWDGRVGVKDFDKAPPWVRDALNRLERCALTASGPTTRYLAEVGKVVEAEMRGRDSVEASQLRHYGDKRSHDVERVFVAAASKAAHGAGDDSDASDDEHVVEGDMSSALKAVRDAVKPGGLGPGPPPQALDPAAVAAELEADRLAGAACADGLDAAPRRVCALAECAVVDVRSALLKSRAKLRRDALDAHGDACGALGEWCERRWTRIQQILNTPCADAATTVALELLLGCLDHLLAPLQATARDAHLVAETLALHGRPLEKLRALQVTRAALSWAPKVRATRERAAAEAARARSEHAAALNELREAYEVKLAACAALVRRACRHNPKHRGEGQLDAACAALAAKAGDCLGCGQRLDLLGDQLLRLRAAEKVLRKFPRTPRAPLQKLREAFEPHRHLARAAGARVEIKDALQDAKLGEADASRKHAQETLPETLALAKRAHALFERRFKHRALEKAEAAKNKAKPKFGLAKEEGEEFDAEDAVVVAACTACGAADAPVSDDEGGAPPAPAPEGKPEEKDLKPVWTTLEIANSLCHEGDHNMRLDAAVADLEVGMVSRPPPKPVTDAVALTTGRAEAPDDAYVTKRDKLTVLECWGPSLEAKLGIPLGRRTRVGDVRNDGLVKHRAEIAKFADSVRRTRKALAAARRLEEAWNRTVLVVVPHKVTKPAEGGKRAKVLVAGPRVDGVDDLRKAFDASLLELDSLQCGPLVGEDPKNAPAARAAREVAAVARALRAAEAALDRWMLVQGAWRELAYVFATGGDQLSRQLPSECKRYAHVTKLLAKCCGAARGRDGGGAAHVLRLPERVGGPLGPQLDDALGELDAVRRGLTDFACARRLSFARLFFVPERDLLHLLLRDAASSQEGSEAQASELVARAFPGVGGLKFDTKGNISHLVGALPNASRAMAAPPVAPERARDELEIEPQSTAGPPELWLKDLEQAMKLAHRSYTAKAVRELGDEGRGAWAAKACLSPGLLAVRLAFAAEAEALFGDSGMVAPRELKRRQLLRIASLARQMAPALCAKLGAFASLELAHRDAAEALIDAVAVASTDYAWARQLRFYADPSRGGLVVAEAALARRACGDEYRGGGQAPHLRVVLTPTCDRCVLALLAALRSGAAGLLVGGAGSGKASLGAELAVALACPLVRLDCGLDRSDPTALGHLFRGALESGSWLLLSGLAKAGAGALAALGHHLGELQAALRAHRGLGQEASTTMMTATGRHTEVAPSGAAEVLDVDRALLKLPLQRRPPPGAGEDGAVVLGVLDLTLSSRAQALPASLAPFARPAYRAPPPLGTVAELLLSAAGFSLTGARAAGRRLAAAVGLLKEDSGARTAAQVLDPKWSTGAAALRADEAWDAGLALARERPLRLVGSVVGAASELRAATDDDALAAGDGHLVYQAFLDVVLPLVVDEVPALPDRKGRTPASDRWDDGARRLASTLIASVAGDAFGEEYAQKYEGGDRVARGTVVEEAWRKAAAEDRAAKVRAARAALCEVDAFPRPEAVDLVMKADEALTSRGACCVVGPPGSGKSQALRAAAFMRKKTVTKVYPRALSQAELFGVKDPETGAWLPGALDCCLASADGLVVVDGPADPSWGDALVLHLDARAGVSRGHVSGASQSASRLPKATPSRVPCPLALETDSLARASPALCARLQICAARPPDVLCDALDDINDWIGADLNRVAPDLGPKLAAAVSAHVAAALALRKRLVKSHASRGGPGDCAALEASCVPTFKAIVEGLLLAPLRARPGQPVPNDDACAQAALCCEAAVVWASAWAFGSSLDAPERKAFGTALTAAARGRGVAPKLPEEGQLWDYSLDLGRTKWEAWEKCLPKPPRKPARRPDDPVLLPDPAPWVGDLVIPTPQAAAAARMGRLVCVAAGRHLLLLGGCRDADARTGARAAALGLLGCCDGPSTYFDRAVVLPPEEAKGDKPPEPAWKPRAEEPKKKKKKKGQPEIAKPQRRPSLDALETKQMQEAEESRLRKLASGDRAPAERHVRSAPVLASAATTAADLRHDIEVKLERRRRGVFGAAPGQTLVLEMDDVSLLPARSESGLATEWLRQLLDARTWRAGPATAATLGAPDAKQTDTLEIEDVTLLATAADGRPFFRAAQNLPPAPGDGWCGGSLPPRLARHLCAVRVDDADARALGTAFAAVVADHIGRAGAGGRSIPIISNATAKVVAACGAAAQKALGPSAGPTLVQAGATSQRALLDAGALAFGRRDVARVLQGFLGAQPETLAGDSSVGSANEIAQLWAHEARRVLRDRLPESDQGLDRRRFEDLLREAAEHGGSNPLGGDEWANVVPPDEHLDFVDFSTDVLKADDEAAFLPGKAGVFDDELGQRPEMHDDGVDDVDARRQGAFDDATLPSVATADEAGGKRPAPDPFALSIAPSPERVAYKRVYPGGSDARRRLLSSARAAEAEHAIRRSLPPPALFDASVADVLRIARALRRPQGHAVVLGGEASGRRTLARLACRLVGGETLTVPELVSRQRPPAGGFGLALAAFLRQLGEPWAPEKDEPEPRPAGALADDDTVTVASVGPVPGPAPAPAPAPAPPRKPPPVVEEQKVPEEPEAPEAPPLALLVVAADDLGDDQEAWRCLAAAMAHGEVGLVEGRRQPGVVEKRKEDMFRGLTGDEDAMSEATAELGAAAAEAATLFDDGASVVSKQRKEERARALDAAEASARPERVADLADRAARVKARLRVVVCCGLGDAKSGGSASRADAAHHRLARLARREPAVFSAATTVVRCAPWTRDARVALASAAFATWSQRPGDAEDEGADPGDLCEAAAEAAADIHEAAAREYGAFWRQEPGRGGAVATNAAFVAMVRDASRARRRRVAEGDRRLDRVGRGLACWRAARVGAASLRAAQSSAGATAAAEKEALAQAKAERSSIEARADELQSALMEALKSKDAGAQKSAKEELDQLTRRMDRLDAEAKRAKESSRAQAAGGGAAQARAAVAAQLATAIQGDAIRWAHEHQRLRAARASAARDALLGAAAATYCPALPRGRRARLWEAWAEALDEALVEYPGADELSAHAPQDLDDRDLAEVRALHPPKPFHQTELADMDALALETLGRSQFHPLEWRLSGVRADAPGAGVDAAALLLGRRWPLLIDPDRVARRFIIRAARATAARRNRPQDEETGRQEWGVVAARLRHPGFKTAFEEAARCGEWLVVEGLGDPTSVVEDADEARRCAREGAALPALDGGWTLPPELAYAVQAGRALVERQGGGPASIPLLGAPAPVPASEHFRLFLTTDETDGDRVPARLHGACAVVDARCGGLGGAGRDALEAHVLWDVLAPAELPQCARGLSQLAPRRAALTRQCAAKEDALFCVLVECAPLDSDEAPNFGADGDEQASAAMRKELQTAMDNLTKAQKETRDNCFREMHLCKVASTGPRLGGVSATLLDERDLVYAAEEASREVAAKREALAKLDFQDLKHRTALEPLRAVAARAATVFGALAALEGARNRGCYHAGLGAFGRRLKRVVRDLSQPKRLPAQAERKTDEGEAPSTKRRVDALSATVSRAAHRQARTGIFSRDRLVLGVRLAAALRRSKKDEWAWDEAEWKYVLTGDTPEAADPVASAWTGFHMANKGRVAVDPSADKRERARRDTRMTMRRGCDAGETASGGPAVGWWVSSADLRQRASDAATLPALAGLPESLERASDLVEWNRVVESEDPFSEPFPGSFGDATPLQKLCVIRAIRFDGLARALEGWVKRELGGDESEDEEEPGGVSAFDAALRDADADAAAEEAVDEGDAADVPPPILLALAEDAEDPAPDVRRLAKDRGVKLVVAGATGVDAAAALRFVRTASAEGHWVLLQQCELAGRSFLRQLAWLIVDQPAVGRGVGGRRGAPAPGFRLWLAARLAGDATQPPDGLAALMLAGSTKPSDALPAALAREAVTVAVEPARGVRGVVLRAARSDVSALELGGADGHRARFLLRCIAVLGLCRERRAALGTAGWSGFGVVAPGAVDEIKAAAHAVAAAWPFCPGFSDQAAAPARRDSFKAGVQRVTMKNRQSLLKRASMGGKGASKGGSAGHPMLAALRDLLNGPAVAAASCGGRDADARVLDVIATLALSKGRGFEPRQPLLNWPPGAATSAAAAWVTPPTPMGPPKGAGRRVFLAAAHQLPSSLSAPAAGGAPASRAARDAAVAADAATTCARLERALGDVSALVGGDAQLAAVLDDMDGVFAKDLEAFASGSLEEDLNIVSEGRILRRWDEACAFARRTKTAKPPRPTPEEIPDPPTPWDLCLYAERDLVRALVQSMKRDVADLRAALSGRTPDDRERSGAVARALRVLEAPDVWRSLAKTSAHALSLGPWLARVRTRAATLNGWRDDFRAPDPLPLGALARPGALYEATRLRAARHWGVPLDGVWIGAKPQKEKTDDDDLESFVPDLESEEEEVAGAPAAALQSMPPPRVVLSLPVGGLCLDGARFEGNRLLDNTRPDATYADLPPVLLEPLSLKATPKEAEKALEQKGFYRCPVYSSAARGPTPEFWIDLPSSQPSSDRRRLPSEGYPRAAVSDQPFWVLRGVAAVLDTPDDAREAPEEEY